MSAVVRSENLAKFRVEIPRSSDHLGMILLEMVPLWGELYNARRPEGRVPFNPDMDVVVNLVGSGAMRFITARVGDRVVALQQWTVVPDIIVSGRVIAMMTAIHKRERGVFDMDEFVSFGVQAMRDAGAQQIVLTAVASNKNYLDRLERMGARIVEHILEF
jgi:hypothetical protein